MHTRFSVAAISVQALNLAPHEGGGFGLADIFQTLDHRRYVLGTFVLVEFGLGLKVALVQIKETDPLQLHQG